MYDIYDTPAALAALQEQAEAQHEEQYQAWKQDMLENGESEDDVTREKYDDMLVGQAEALSERW